MKELKKYIIGFIIGLSLVTGISYAVNTGSIGGLFTQIGGNWFLEGSNIKNISIDKSKLKEILSSEITANTAKIGITIAQSDAIIANTAKSAKSDDEINALIDAKISCTVNGEVIKSGGSVVLYKNEVEDYGNNCTSEKRVCTGNELTGSYTYKTCSVTSLSNSNNCNTIGGYCKGGIYIGDNTVIQTSNLGLKYINDAINSCNNSTAGGKSDWILPNIAELSDMYTSKNTTGGFVSDWYLSRTDDKYTNEWGFSLNSQMHFGNGRVYSNEYNRSYIHCIRNF